MIPEPPAGYEIKQYKPGELVGEGALYVPRELTGLRWDISGNVGNKPSPDCFYCVPIRPRELRWYDLSKGEKPTEADCDDHGNLIYVLDTANEVSVCSLDWVLRRKIGIWHPIAKFPTDPEETAAIELLKSRGYRVEKEER